MYPDPNRVRCYRIAINLNKYEHELIEAYSNYTGIDKSSLVRQMAMAEAERLMLDTQTNEAKDKNKVHNK